METEIASYADTFKKIDSGLSKPNCTWIDWSSGELYCADAQSNGFPVFDNVGQLRDVARGLNIRSLQALSDGRFDDVVADGVRCLRVAESLSVNAVFLTSLIGTAIEGIGISITQSGINNASRAQLKRAGERLDEMIAVSMSADQEMDQLLKNEAELMWTHVSWQGRLFSFHLGDARDGVRESVVRRNTYRILLRTEIAAEIFHRDHGRYPESLRELTPQYLMELPINPYASRNKQVPLRYSAAPDGLSYQVCSVGINGIYDGFVDRENYIRVGDMDLSVIFGDRLEENKKEYEAYQSMFDEELTLDDEYESEPFMDDELESRLDELELNGIEKNEDDQLKPTDSHPNKQK